MSYDVSIGDFEANYTSNVATLFYDSIPNTGKGGGLKELDGLKGRDAGQLLGQAFDSLNRKYIDKGRIGFRSLYDAPNGWGSSDGALIFVARIMAACYDNPRKTVRVSW